LKNGGMKAANRDPEMSEAIMNETVHGLCIPLRSEGFKAKHKLWVSVKVTFIVPD